MPASSVIMRCTHTQHPCRMNEQHSRLNGAALWADRRDGGRARAWADQALLPAQHARRAVARTPNCIAQHACPASRPEGAWPRHPAHCPPSLEAGIRRQGVEDASGTGGLCLLPRRQPAGPAQHVEGGAQPAGERDGACSTAIRPVRLSTVAACLIPSFIQRPNVNGSLQDPLQVDLMTSGMSSVQTQRWHNRVSPEQVLPCAIHLVGLHLQASTFQLG